MPARLVTIDECNAQRVIVLFDANVLIDAMRAATTVRDLLTRVAPPLRHVASPTRYEVAFAHQGFAASRLQQNDGWIADHLIKRVTSREIDWGVEFERVVDTHAATLRGRADLGDALLFAAAVGLARKGRRTAIATRNKADFEQLPVALVSDFF